MAVPKNGGIQQPSAVPEGDAEFEAAAPQDPDEAQAQGGLSKDEVRERRTKAYSQGQSRLREEHREDFQRIVKEEASKLGIEYVFAPTAAEKARAQIAALLEQFPEARDSL